MEISDVRVRIVGDASERLKAVCSVTFDELFVVRDVKVVEGTSGLFVAMPSRKLTAPCPKCRSQNHLRARSCNECGTDLPSPRIPLDGKGREKVHRDIAHPIAPEFREALQERVLEAFRAECEKMHEEEHVDEREAIEAPDDGEKTERTDEIKEDAVPAAEVQRGDSDEEREAAPEITEYSELIADLKGGGRSRPRADGRSDSSRGGDRDRGAVSSGGRSAPRREREQQRPVDRERAREGPPASRERNTEEPKRARPDVVAATTPPVEDDKEDAFGSGLHEPVEKKPVTAGTNNKDRDAKPSTVSPPPVEKPAATDQDDNDNGFGAGIL